MKISEIQLAPSMIPTREKQQEMVAHRVLSLLDQAIGLLHKVPIDGLAKDAPPTAEPVGVAVAALHTRIMKLLHPATEEPKPDLDDPDLSHMERPIGRERDNAFQYEKTIGPILNPRGFPYDRPGSLLKH